MNTFAADQAVLPEWEARGEPEPDDQVSRLLQSTMTAGTRQEAEDADDALIELIRKDLHGRSKPLGHWQPFPDQR